MSPFLQNFNTLVKMAEESDGRTTDLYGSDFTKLDRKQIGEDGSSDAGTEEVGNAYCTAGHHGDLLLFPFGRPAATEGVYILSNFS